MKLLQSLFVITSLVVTTTCVAAEPLASWQEGARKNTIIEFVKKTTTEGSKDFIAVADRVAVFDNDGTLWAEQPAYFQLFFALSQVKQLAPDNPQWKTTQPYADILQGKIPAHMTEKDLIELVMNTHAGMTSEVFTQQVSSWMSLAKHPITKKPFTDMVYQPMLELLTYLREHDYKTFIVSGGGVEFMRAWAPDVYGIPAEQIIGSRIASEYKVIDGVPKIVRLPELEFNNDKAGKPIGIYNAIGKRPIIAVGNSDGDRAMLEWTTAGAESRLGVIVHHTDKEREWAYDKDSKIGKLDKALIQAEKENWLVVDMKNDWSVVYKK
ncbi:haloacid dehalogenase-like hydrolase [Colwellia sp. D2M02]|uniref:HAD family hydrolase n=1 Tax=Colwellia sp. D2M02 TaxID=2841562 RepID=UPI001C0A0705|nr:HAD family hydrolase [Colwellia sp. D2M02]MBU2893612.1 haloacid dehalogenase-like hydrolase [Colwellia sp. D2M02]